MVMPKDIARSYPRRGLTADLGFRSEPKFCGDGSVEFDGTSDFATATTYDGGGTETTMVYWFKANSTAGTTMPFANGGASNSRNQLQTLITTGTLRAADAPTNIPFSIDANRWYMLAIVGDSGGLKKAYLDGVDGGSPVSYGHSITATSLTLGARSTGPTQPFNGKLARFRIFNVELTQDQIRELYNNPGLNFPTGLTSSNLRRNYELETDFNDSGADSENATATGSPSFTVDRPQLPRGLDLARGAAMARVYTGRAVDFDGSADHLDAAVYSNSSDYYSVSVWIKPDAIGANRNIVASGDTGDNAFLIFLISTGEIRFYGNDTGGDYAITHQNTLEAGRWYHLAMSVDQSDAANNTIKAYVDGVENTTSKSVAGWIGNASALEIAARNSTSLFDGAIAGVKVFNSELTAAQIQELYHNPEQILPTGVSASNLRRYYPLSDYNDTGGTGGRYFQDMGADGEPAEDQGSALMAFAQPVPCPQLGLQQSATRVYFENNATRADATLGAAPGTTCTMSAWVMVESTGNYQYIFTQGTSAAAIAWFGIAKNNSDNKLYTLQGGVIAAYSSLQLSGYGEWNHVVAMTKSTAPYVRFFINGVEDTSINDISMAAYNLTSTSVSIGGNPVYTNHTQGFANDCAIWDVELSDPEVAALYNSGVQGMDVSTVQSANLKGWWKCDDLTSFKDYSGNGVNATLTGSVNAASFPENASGSTIVGDFSMKRKGVSILNINNDQGYAYALGQDKPSYFPKAGATGYSMSVAHRPIKMGTFEIFWGNDNPAGTPGNDQFILAMQVSGAYTWSLGDGSSRPQVSTSTGTADGEWHILTLTIDYSVSPARWTTYVDGIQSTTGTASISGPPGNFYDVSFGRWRSGGYKGSSASGCHRFYDVALSADEVKRLAFSDLRLIKGLANE